MTRYTAVYVLVLLATCIARGDSTATPIEQLVLSEPVVFINAPFPRQARTAKVGQTVLVQISYPIAPPFPKSASVESANGGFSPVGIFRTDGEVAILRPESKRGRLGVGFLSVMAKAIKQGQTTLKAKIAMSDGTVKEVAIPFDIEQDR
jgi:hypothetical protein